MNRCVLMSCVLLVSIAERPAFAAIITQRDITGGTIHLHRGSLGHVSGTFTQNGPLVREQYQPLPNMFPLIQIGSPRTFSVVTSSGQPVLNLSPPSGTATGNAMTVNLSSLFAGLSSAQRGSGMTTTTFGSLNIGGNAAGTFNKTTIAFNISWIHAFTRVPFLKSETCTVQGTAQIAAVPLQVAAVGWSDGAVL